jgi:hypothetical protein
MKIDSAVKCPQNARYSDMTSAFSSPAACAVVLHYDAAAVTLLGCVGVLALVDLADGLALQTSLINMGN